jgi:hypothetical protein
VARDNFSFNSLVTVNGSNSGLSTSLGKSLGVTIPLSSKSSSLLAN